MAVKLANHKRRSMLAERIQAVMEWRFPAQPVDDDDEDPGAGASRPVRPRCFSAERATCSKPEFCAVQCSSLTLNSTQVYAALLQSLWCLKTIVGCCHWRLRTSWTSRQWSLSYQFVCSSRRHQQSEHQRCSRAHKTQKTFQWRHRAQVQAHLYRLRGTRSHCPCPKRCQPNGLQRSAKIHSVGRQKRRSHSCSVDRVMV